MFYYISGTLTFKTDKFAVIDAGGVGYKIYSTLPSLSALGEIGSDAKMYTYLRTGDGIFDLYGFASPEEYNMFEMLLGVSGVGGKGAISVLSSVSPAKFALAIITGDVNSIKQAQGVGPKLAQRIILELKDKFKSNELPDITADEMISYVPDSPQSEVIDALAGLGYSRHEADKAIKGLDPTLSIEDAIKFALRNLLPG